MSGGIRGATVVLAALLSLGGLVFAAVTHLRERAAHDRVNEVSTLPDVDQASPGGRSVLEGIIAHDVAELGHGFVAYVERQHMKNSTRVIGGLLQPLRLQTHDGVAPRAERMAVRPHLADGLAFSDGLRRLARAHSAARPVTWSLSCPTQSRPSPCAPQ